MRFFVLMIGFLVLCASVQARTQFFDVLSDVPVADGLIVLPEQGLVFNKPEARIVETVSALEAGVSAEAVTDYYREILPAFGWHMQADGVYMRGIEVLRTWFEVNDGQQFFHLRIAPAD